MINGRTSKFISGMAFVAILCVAPASRAGDRERDYRDRAYERGEFTRIERGTTVAVRTNETIDMDEWDNRVYTGIVDVDHDVRDTNGRLAIPLGSKVELIVRVAGDCDLVLDLESITVGGQRYAIRMDAQHIESRPDNSPVASMVGAVNGGRVPRRAVRVPRNSILTFRIEQPLDIGVADRGTMRDGRHYHDDSRDR